MSEFSKKQISYLIGIGAFILATISGFTYLAQTVLRDFQIWYNQEPVLNYWINESLVFIIFIFLGIVALRTIHNQKNYSEIKLRKLFFLWVIAFIVAQVFQYLYAVFGTDFVLEHRLDEFSNYTNTMVKEYSLHFYQSISAILRYLIFGLIVFFAGKNVEKNL